MTFHRRDILKGMAITAGAQLFMPVIRVAQAGANDCDYVLIAEAAPIEFIAGKITKALTFNQQIPAPTLRVKQGERIRVKLINNIHQPTTIHWHGIRIANSMDGVPHLTQHPVMPGESFIYDFVCPDAGTFWYHPHTHSLEQLGKGLMGCLIVDEKEGTDFDAEQLLVLRDWHIDKEGQFTAMTSLRNAARMGTLGNHQTVNGKVKPVYEIPAGGAIRVRLANVDNTRLYHLSTKEYPAMVIAEEGNPLKNPYPLTDRATGAGMRVDIALIAPKTVGEEVIIYDKKGKWYFELCRLKTVASNKPVRASLPTLPYHHIPEPNLKKAKQVDFVFEWEGALTPAEGEKSNPVFWTINRRAWVDESHEVLPEPIATFKKNKSYIINLYNASPHHHPIHMHGHTFKVLNSDKREITPYFTDTILLAKNERAQIAFVADNVGKWMFHCHVIEHMMTGLMGYIVVK
jgi:FtsP/CotA-like multicopper oxidase with cupredoxin domain